MQLEQERVKRVENSIREAERIKYDRHHAFSVIKYGDVGRYS